MHLNQRPKLHPPKALLARQPERPRPSLAFAGQAPANPILAPHELRRLIAGMIG